jgi:hypothetical protein
VAQPASARAVTNADHAEDEIREMLIAPPRIEFHPAERGDGLGIGAPGGRR